MTISKKAPALPIYESIFKLSKSAGPSWTELDPITIRTISDSFPLPPGVVIPETHVEEREINIDLQETAGQQSSSTIKLTISRPLGGGFVFGSFRTSEKFIKDLTVMANVAVIFVDYSLSPEVHFPVAPEESYSSVLWIHQHAGELKIDASKLIVGGDSAGGNLAAVMPLLLKNRGYNDILKGHVLMYPCLEPNVVETESRELYGDGDYFSSRADIDFYMKHYLGDYQFGKGIKDIRLSPFIATNEELTGLPPALVITSECDALRDEGEEYARHLSKAGVKTTAIRAIGTMHSFLTMPIDTDIYISSIQSISNFIHRSI
ncbi:unnamed protein product [Cunninghamella blakesleeana]